MERETPRRLGFVWLSVIWLVIAGFVWIELYGFDFSIGWRRALVVLLFGPPLWVLFHVAAELLGKALPGARGERNPGSRFSLRRIAVGILTGGAVVATLLVAAVWLTS